MSSGVETINDALSNVVEAERQKIPDISHEPTAPCYFGGVNCPLTLFKPCAPRLRFDEVRDIYDDELKALLGDACDFEKKLGHIFEDISPVPFRGN